MTLRDPPPTPPVAPVNTPTPPALPAPGQFRTERLDGPPLLLPPHLPHPPGLSLCLPCLPCPLRLPWFCHYPYGSNARATRVPAFLPHGRFATTLTRLPMGLPLRFVIHICYLPLPHCTNARKRLPCPQLRFFVRDHRNCAWLVPHARCTVWRYPIPVATHPIAVRRFRCSHVDWLGSWNAKPHLPTTACFLPLLHCCLQRAHTVYTDLAAATVCLPPHTPPPYTLRHYSCFRFSALPRA